MIVDDDPDDIELLIDTLLLIDQSYKIIVVHNGLEALEALGLAFPDAILTDMNMPLMDGRELINEITSKALSVPVFVMSTSDLGVIDGIALGAADGFVKPSSIQQLIHELRRTII